MKRLFFMFLAVVFSGIVLSACNSDPAEPLNYSDYKKATVSGKVLVCVDESVSYADRKWAAAPGTIVITAQVLNSQLAYGGNAYGYYETKAKYNATTGEYSVTVPVSAVGSSVYIYVKEWKGSVKINDNGGGTPTIKDIPVLWNTHNLSASLKPGDDLVEKNLYYQSAGNYNGNYRAIEDEVGGNIN